MQGVALSSFRRMHHQIGVEVGGTRRRGAERQHAVCFARGETVAVRGGGRKHRFQTEAPGRAYDAQGDFAAVGDEDAAQAHVRRRVR